MDFSYIISGTPEVLAGLQSLPDRLRVELNTEMEDIVAYLAMYVVTDKLSGQVLAQRSGRLAGSVGGGVTTDAGGTVTGTVTADAPYAGIQERGGVTKPHTILPVTGRALKFRLGDQDVFASRVKHPGSVMPERSYLRSSLVDLHDRIVGDLSDAVARSIRP